MGKSINPLPLVSRADQEGATLTPEEIEILEDAADEAAVTKRTQIPDGAVLTAEEIEILEDAEEEGTTKIKRQSAGFTAALAYASAYAFSLWIYLVGHSLTV